MKKRSWFVHYDEDGITDVEFYNTPHPARKYIILVIIASLIYLSTLIFT